jgi:hypothetical protein
VTDDYAFRRAVNLDEPVKPIEFGLIPSDKNAVRETAILFLSDLHWGEVVSGPAIDYVNSFDIPIARARLERCFQATVDLLTRHSAGPGFDSCIVVLGGDLVSGSIHEELSKTNEAAALPAARDLVGYLIGGINLLREQLRVPIQVISVVGNHGRSTLKPESKGNVSNSYDTLVCWLLELAFQGEPDVSFVVPQSVDCLLSLSGWNLLITHGDRMGSRGGSGAAGCAPVVAKGFKKVVMDYAARGQRIDYILCGHFHTALRLEEGWVNASLVGPNEYGRDARFRPAPATQLLLTLHPSRGVVQERRIQVGDPSEGTIYAPPPSRGDARPRYRVPAVGVAA